VRPPPCFTLTQVSKTHFFGVVRLNSGRTLDSTFGMGGELTTQFNSWGQVLASALTRELL
jgi:hypothetical protein